MLAYLRNYHNSNVIFDIRDPVIDEVYPKRKYWALSDSYVTINKSFQNNIPEPRSIGFRMRSKFYEDHVSDTVTWKSRTLLLVYLNSVPIYWNTKDDNSVDARPFRLEFITTKQ